MSMLFHVWFPKDTKIVAWARDMCSQLGSQGHSFLTTPKHHFRIVLVLQHLLHCSWFRFCLNSSHHPPITNHQSFLDVQMAMDQYLLPFLGGWTSIYQLFWCELQGYKVLTHCQILCHLAPGEDAEDAVDLLCFLRKQKGLAVRRRSQRGSPRSSTAPTVNKHGDVLQHQQNRQT